MVDTCRCGHHAEDHECRNGYTGACLDEDCDCACFEPADEEPWHDDPDRLREDHIDGLR